MTSTIQQRKLLAYANGEGGGLRSYSRLRGVTIGLTGVIAAGALAYILGRHPPRHSQITYRQERVQAPIVQLHGYDPENFSRLELLARGASPVTFFPATAVKKWDGAHYSERSRQTGGELYATRSLADTTLTLYFPQEPQQVMIAGRDFSTTVRPVAGGYKVSVPLPQALPQAARQQRDTSVEAELEVLIYYHSPDSTKVTKERPPRHLEDAERYVLRVIEHG